MTKELEIYFKDVDYAVETFIESLNARYKRQRFENELIHELMVMKYIEKRDVQYIYDLKCIPYHLIQRVYG